jgi:hypothetical protein
MKKTISLAIIAAFILASALAYAGGMLEVNTIIKNIRPDTMTKAQIKEYYKTVRGKMARGTGRIVDFSTGRGKYKATILTSASHPAKGYNVVLYARGEAPKGLNRGQTVKFEGKVGRISTFRGLSVDIKGSITK